MSSEASTSTFNVTSVATEDLDGFDDEEDEHNRSFLTTDYFLIVKKEDEFQGYFLTCKVTLSFKDESTSNPIRHLVSN